MRQRAGQQSYVPSESVHSLHGHSSARRSAGHRHGFTLVELVVAFAIMLILIVGLLGAYSRNMVSIRTTQIMETAQNLAELQVEDLRSMSMASLKVMVWGPVVDPNYPLDHDPSIISYVSTGSPNPADGFYASDFFLPRVDSIVLGEGTPSSAKDGVVGAAAPPMLIPGSVEVGPIHLLNPSGVSPTDNVYGVVVVKSAFPNVEKKVEVKLIGDGTSVVPDAATFDWAKAKTGSLLFQYGVTVRWTDSSGTPHLYSVGGYLGENIVQTPSAPAP